MRRQMMCVFTVMAAASLGCSAVATDYVATLTGAAQRPNPVNTPGTGLADVTITGNQLTFTIQVQSLLGVTTVAHIHRVNDTTDPDNSAGGVIIDLIGPAGNPANGWTTISGSTTASDAQIADINLGFTYVNVHSTLFPAGEVRGKLMMVPEPATLGALAAGLVGVISRRKRH